jgi:alkylated DNA nucleotide flippase Atl1
MINKFTSRTRWREKLEKEQEPKVVKIPPKMSRFGKGTMLIPTPKLVDDLVRKVPKGKLVTVGELRRRLAANFASDVTCPLTTGIFLRIAAETAEEDRANGRKRITPYWRVVKDDGSLNPKFPGGAEKQARYLKAEGFAVRKNGKKPPQVKEFERRVINLL